MLQKFGNIAGSGIDQVYTVRQKASFGEQPNNTDIANIGKTKKINKKNTTNICIKGC